MIAFGPIDLFPLSRFKVIKLISLFTPTVGSDQLSILGGTDQAQGRVLTVVSHLRKEVQNDVYYSKQVKG